MKSSTEIVRDYIKNHGYRKAGIAKQINHSASNLQHKLEKSDMTVDLLINLSIALKHDFLHDLSRQLPADVRHRGLVVETSPLEQAVIDLVKKHLK